jgi:hypothetical protein
MSYKLFMQQDIYNKVYISLTPKDIIVGIIYCPSNMERLIEFLKIIDKDFSHEKGLIQEVLDQVCKKVPGFRLYWTFS